MEEQVQEVAPEIIERAKGMGWIPKEEFKGDESRWRPADEYVKRADELMPIMKKQMSKYEDMISSQTGKITELERSISTQKETAEKLLKMSQKVQEQAYEKAKRDIKAKQIQAVTDGDAEKWAALEEEKENLQKPEPIVTQPEESQPQTPSEFVEWKGKNDWYQTDNDLTIFADAYGKSLKEQNPTMTYNQILAGVEARVKEVFKYKFENPQRNNPPPVDETSQRGTGGSGSRKKSYNDLPGDAKAQCDIWIKDGLFKSREDYVKSYFEEE